MTTLRKCSSGLVETDIDGERVVMSLESGEFFALKDTALEIWRLLDTCADRADLLCALSRTYAMSPSALAGDLDAFLAQLAESGLVGQG